MDKDKCFIRHFGCFNYTFLSEMYLLTIINRIFADKLDFTPLMIETIYNFAYQQLELIGTIVGLIYLWLEYKASIYLWITGIIMPTIYLFIYYNAGLYADFGINVYYLLAAIYGWVMWKYTQHTSKEPSIHQDETTSSSETNTHGIQSILAIASSRRILVNLCLTTSILFLFIAWILIRFTDSTVPWIDSFTTALSIAAMWMLAKKYIEQWWTWFVVDVVSSGLYIYKELYFTAALYMLYAIIAIFGYYKWIELMNSKIKRYDTKN